MQLQVFKFEEEDHFSQLRTIEIDGEIWFVASDVAKALGYKRPIEAARQHCKTKGTVKHRIPTESGEQEMLLINEPNVYRLIIKSQLPSAEKFEEWVFEQVIPSIRKKGFYGSIDRSVVPNFLLRYNDNWNRTEKGYFSVISELFVDLFGRLEMVGYNIPNKGVDGKEIRPDVSVGILFRKYLGIHHPDKVDNFKMYKHRFQNGMEFECKQYPNNMLHIFRQFVEDVWIPERASAYFAERDRMALDYLPKLLRA